MVGNSWNDVAESYTQKSNSLLFAGGWEGHGWAFLVQWVNQRVVEESDQLYTNMASTYNDGIHFSKLPKGISKRSKTFALCNSFLFDETLSWGCFGRTPPVYISADICYSIHEQVFFPHPALSPLSFTCTDLSICIPGKHITFLHTSSLPSSWFL